MNFEERELCKFLETYYKREVKRKNYKYFGDDKFVLLPIDLLNENFGFSAYKLRSKFKNISEETSFQTRLGQSKIRYFAFEKKKISRFENIKKMDVDKFSNFLSDVIYCNLCPATELCDTLNVSKCYDVLKHWLLQECE